MADCEHKKVKEIGRFTVDCGLAGEITWIRRRCLDCNEVTMTKIYNGEEPDEKTDLIPPKKTRKKRQAHNSINNLVDKENP